MLKNKASLANLMLTVEKGWVFNEDRYPLMSYQKQDLFILQHTILHMQTALADMARQLERSQHGRGINHAILELATKKQFVNVLRVAAEFGVSAPELADHVIVSFAE